MTDFSQLQSETGLKFKNQELIEQAFTHRSYINEHPEISEHNERLEFLGDAVIELIVTEYLYKKFPDQPEGELTSLRSALVRRDTLSEIGQELNFDDYLRLSRGEIHNTDKAKAVILSNTTEAFVGAIFLDQGIKPVQKFLNKFLLPKLDKIVSSEQHIDAKSRFQEVIQEQEGITPHYKTERTSGPDHRRTFEVGLYVGDKLITRGTGSSKREAEADAASKALEDLED